MGELGHETHYKNENPNYDTLLYKDISRKLWEKFGHMSAVEFAEYFNKSKLKANQMESQKGQSTEARDGEASELLNALTAIEEGSYSNLSTAKQIRESVFGLTPDQPLDPVKQSEPSCLFEIIRQKVVNIQNHLESTADQLSRVQSGLRF